MWLRSAGQKEPLQHKGLKEWGKIVSKLQGSAALAKVQSTESLLAALFPHDFSAAGKNLSMENQFSLIVL